MTGGRARMLAVAAAAVAVLSGCQVAKSGDNLVNGKVQFNEQCARCHTLARAGAKGVIGPNLDEAWQRSEQDGMARSYFKGLVYGQIQNPNRFPQVDPRTGKNLAAMPANLVKGQDAQDVAAYVAFAAARKGDDSGRLADVGGGAKGTAEAKGGTLDIPVGTGLNYKFKDAEAPAGSLTIDSKNEQPTGHNIAVEGDGVDEKGEVVQGGATSTVKVDLKPGNYTFFCSVPGHREGGMVGKLTVK